ncbi:aspartyl-phosphate phosphatase Spo0E family protein [Bacillus sp. FJAT-22090]|uniref:aspartyl-phosphate phosphatase Spo0E family protein n=1 Tax=Bacillus sp. FJAT-22090 TaxID=1581038 RepID=UPI0011A89272|nr:aspartyl-phosphate phosphatase Spo0E family protein [Bacillus sp. FJAT-22090]
MEKSILMQMESTREKMVLAANEKGVSHQETIELSKELDRLLNEYQSMKNLK